MMDLEYLKEQPVVCISTLIRDRGWILPCYLEHLYNLNYNKSKIIIYWLVNDCSDDSERILTNFKREHGHEYREIIIEKVKNRAPMYKRSIAKNPVQAEKYWHDVYSNLAALRNKVIDKVLEFNEVEFLFNIDSDILVNSNDLNLLLKQNCDIVAGIINNDLIRNPSLNKHFAACNILNFNDCGKVYHITGWSDEDGLVPVGATGAVAIFRTELFKRYSTLRYGFCRQGEDIEFFRIAKELGIKSFAYTGVQPTHAMGIMQDICKNCDSTCKQFSFQDGERKGILVTCSKFKEKV
jgi:hypothetical protein